MSSKRKLLQEDRWSRLYQTGRNRVLYASKFRTDRLSVSFDQLRSEWAVWDRSERLSFASAYRYKPEITAQDERIMEFLAKKGDHRVRATIPIFLTRHPNKRFVLRFLLRGLGS